SIHLRRNLISLTENFAKIIAFLMRDDNGIVQLWLISPQGGATGTATLTSLKNGDYDHERNLAARFGKSGFINKEGT
ncbi:hypothetical protein O5559_29530, partial [Escherichia coli]|nr:hypothetical protein [Escherichia coli]